MVLLTRYCGHTLVEIRRDTNPELWEYFTQGHNANGDTIIVDFSDFGISVFEKHDNIIIDLGKALPRTPDGSIFHFESEGRRLTILKDRIITSNTTLTKRKEHEYIAREEPKAEDFYGLLFLNVPDRPIIIRASNRRLSKVEKKVLAIAKDVGLPKVVIVGDDHIRLYDPFCDMADATIEGDEMFGRVLPLWFLDVVKPRSVKIKYYDHLVLYALDVEKGLLKVLPIPDEYSRQEVVPLVRRIAV